MSHFICCPDCGVPAEVVHRFVLESTEGPVDHVTLYCAGGHRFVTAADVLPYEARLLLAVQDAAAPRLSSGR